MNKDKLPAVSFDAALCMALRQQADTEDTARPSDRELRELYPETSGWDKRFFRALSARRRAWRRQGPPALRRRLRLRNLLMVALLTILIFVGALAANADVRGAVYRTVLSWGRREVTLTYEVEGEPLDSLPEDYTDTYVPAGFNRDTETSYATKTEVHAEYTGRMYGADRRYALTLCTARPEETASYTRRGAVYTTLDLDRGQATLGILSRVDGGTDYILFWESGGVHHTLEGDLPLDELVRVANGIRTKS